MQQRFDPILQENFTTDIYIYVLYDYRSDKDHLISTEIKHTVFEIFNEKISSIHNNIPTKNMKSNVENTARENGKTIMYV